MKSAIQPSHMSPASPSQKMGPALDENPSPENTHLKRETPNAQDDGRYWGRLHHYLGLHSGDGLQFAKYLALRDPAQRCAEPIIATLVAWQKRHENYASFASQRDAALALIQTELQAIGVPYGDMCNPDTL